MTRKRLAASVLTVAFMLSLADIASARRPPSLVAMQESSERVLSTCPRAPSTSGYRDMLARFDLRAPATHAPAIVTRKTSDHLVLRCVGGEVHESGGYRDMLVRFLREGDQPLLARRGSSPAH